MQTPLLANSRLGLPRSYWPFGRKIHRSYSATFCTCGKLAIQGKYLAPCVLVKERTVISPAIAYWNQRLKLAAARERILALSGAINQQSDLWPFQWAQLMALALEYKPDIVLELGRGKGNSTCAFTEASYMSESKWTILSVCLNNDWELSSLPQIRQIVSDGWLERLKTVRADILDYDFESALRGFTRILIFWDAHGFDVAECVLGRILPLVANLEHLVVMHDLSDLRYDSEARLNYGEHGLWKGNDWSGPSLKLGIIDSSVEQSIAALDFATRNHLTLDSADHSFHTQLTSAQQSDMRIVLGELFEIQAHWFYFSLNERPGPYTFPKYTRNFDRKADSNRVSFGQKLRSVRDWLGLRAPTDA